MANRCTDIGRVHWCFYNNGSFVCIFRAGGGGLYRGIANEHWRPTNAGRDTVWVHGVLSGSNSDVQLCTRNEAMARIPAPSYELWIYTFGTPPPY